MRHRLLFSAAAFVVALGAMFFLAKPTSAHAVEQVVQGSLTAVTSVTLPTTLTVQVDTTSYTVNVTEDTTLVRRFRGTSSLEEFGLGDILKIRGTITGSTIAATYIRNITIQRVGGTFVGVIESINDTDDTFVLDPRGVRDDQTVTTTGNTKIFFGYKTMTFDDLEVGQKVRVVGVWRKSLNTIAADRVHVNLSTVEGRITALNCAGNTMSVKQGSKTWTVTLTTNTAFKDRRGQVILCTNMAVNHKVHVRGVKTGSSAVTAIAVRDQSAGKTVSVHNGQIVSVDVAGNSLVVKKNDTNYTVMVTPASIIVDETGTLITLSSLMVGDDVQIRGVVSGTTITLNLLIDKDLP